MRKQNCLLSIRNRTTSRWTSSSLINPDRPAGPGALQKRLDRQHDVDGFLLGGAGPVFRTPSYQLLEGFGLRKKAVQCGRLHGFHNEVTTLSPPEIKDWGRHRGRMVGEC